MIECKIKFYDIKKCGFYHRGDETPAFGGIADTLTKLNEWASSGREFINTTCYEPDIANDLFNTYFCGWSKNQTTGDCLLVLWNEVFNDNNVIYGINPMARPGETTMLTTGFGDTPAIPGFPSYFWFVPSKRVFAAIKFNHSMQGKSNLDNYISGFLLNKSPYRVLNENDEVIGFSQDANENEDSPRIHPRFHTIGTKQEELEAELLANRSNITRIIKRESLTYAVNDDRGIIERVFSGLLDNSPEFIQTKHITHDLQFSPSEDELIEIIRNFNNLPATSPIRNAGFVLNSGKKIMLRGCSVSLPAELDIQRAENSIIPPETLLNAISQHRNDFLSVLDYNQADIPVQAIA